MKKSAAFLLALSAITGLATPGQAQQAGKLFFEGDLVKGVQGGQAPPFCVLQSQFFHKQRVTWRVRVLDSDHKQVEGKGLKSLVAELSDGTKVQLHFHQHPPAGKPQDYFWSGSWVIPDNHPTGSISYKVVATDNEGKTQVWEPFKMHPSQLTVIAGDPPMAKPK